MVGLIALGFAGLIDFGEGATNFGFTIVAVLLAAAYEIVFVATRGQTPGKMAVGTRVVTEAGDDPPGWGPALIRYAVPGVVGLIPRSRVAWYRSSTSGCCGTKSAKAYTTRQPKHS